MRTSKQNSDFTTSLQELGELHHRNKVAAVRPSGWRSSPVNFDRALLNFDNVLEELGAENLLEVLRDELVFLLGSRHLLRRLRRYNKLENKRVV